jgi:hypothetical protein
MNASMTPPLSYWQPTFFALPSSLVEASSYGIAGRSGIPLEGSCSADFGFVVQLTSWQLPEQEVLPDDQSSAVVELSPRHVLIVPSRCPWHYAGCQEPTGSADWYC